MKCELPVCTKCCFCFPLRYGLVTWGYCKLITNLLIFMIGGFLALHYAFGTVGNKYEREVVIVLSIGLVVVSVDIVLSTLFIVGGHRKNLRLLRVYYVYSVTFMVLTMVMMVLSMILTLDRLIYYMTESLWMYELLDFPAYLVNIIMQAYFVLLLRSEIIKLQRNCEFRFVNMAADYDGTMKHEWDEACEEEGTEDICEKGTCEYKGTCGYKGACHMLNES